MVMESNSTEEFAEQRGEIVASVQKQRKLVRIPTHF